MTLGGGPEGVKVINRQKDSCIKGMAFGSPCRSKVWHSGRLAAQRYGIRVAWVSMKKRALE
ncbi:MAG: hypothetical protein COZ72_03780 [Elusimicrobia bacterium CG_4_8_14_3_um_filter_50_9]|nr:MAG: hypothetical protein COZ72_03780 [Elusimicrobia bacterium CG_4_8_14_3_um_filter_50_9]